MSAVLKLTSTGSGALLSALSLCLVSASLPAADSFGSALLFAGDAIGVAGDHHATAPVDPPPFTMVLDPDAGLNFDLGGSETRKLQLVLDHPLSFQAGMDTRILDNGSDILGLDATLNLPLSNQFGLHAGVDRRFENARFQSLGSIQCVNGTLRADSYTASGCRFVNDPLAASEHQQFNLGARLDLGSASASVNWFTRASAMHQSNVRHLSPPGGTSMITNSLLSPNLGNPLLSAATGDPLQYLDSEASGVNLNFKVGFTTDTRGDVQLGLAFSRVLEADFNSLYSQGGDTLSWTLAQPFNTTRMNLEWSQGSFSTGIQGDYRDSVNFLNRNSLDSLTTFDVHFTWRTPWNANLSVGASNILNAGTDSSTENQSPDPLESIYGRIPYVRYKQDL
jgi:hypothetical protein